MQIALLEDDPDQTALVEEWLLQGGHKCDSFDESREFIKTVKRNTYDILILDWLVPEMSGVEVLEWVRENLDWRIPILFTTQMNSEEDIVHGLNSGADDYMVKPIKPKEMLARIDALGRRCLNTDETDDIFEVMPYKIDRKSRVILKDDIALATTTIEFDLALFLFRNYGRVLSRGYILENVWGRNADVTTRTVDTHVSRIRKKLNIVPDSGWRLAPVYQHGYRLEKLV